MYISKVGVQNFRSIIDTEIDFVKGKNVIIGRNNSGKSNILKAIDLILGGYKFNLETDLNSNTEEKKLKIELEVTIDGYSSWIKMDNFHYVTDECFQCLFRKHRMNQNNQQKLMQVFCIAVKKNGSTFLMVECKTWGKE